VYSPRLLLQGSVFFFEPFIAGCKVFVLLIQFSVLLVQSMIIIDLLEIAYQKAFMSFYRRFTSGSATLVL